MQGGVSPAPSQNQPQRSKGAAFLPDRPINSFRSVTYAASRGLLGEIPGRRYVTLLLVVLAVLWATGLLPGRWYVVGLSLLLLVVHGVTGFVMKRRDYIGFHERDSIDETPARLPASASFPVYVTGRLWVEGGTRRYTCLPGFYRTFATREHALICQVHPRKMLGVLQWPVDEIGMWYAFFQPEEINSVQRGRLSFGPEAMDCIAVDYELYEKEKGRFRNKEKDECSIETLFISSMDSASIDQILADLQVDLADHD